MSSKGICLRCTKEFEGISTKKFCSGYCRNKYNLVPSPEFKKKCIQCDKDFTTTRRYQVYCNKRCHTKMRTWKVPLASYREYVLERDNFTCTKCSKRGVISSDLHVHHPNPLYKGGEHSIDNMITLCVPCHKKEHKVRVDRI